MVHLKIHHIFSIVVTLCFASPIASAQSLTVQIQQQLDQISAENGQLIYSAILSLPATRRDFTGVMGEHSWLTYLPENLHDQLNKSEKSRIQSLLVQDLMTMDAFHRKAVLRQLQDWLDIFHTLAFAEQMTSIEQVMAAIYADPDSKSYFEQAINARKWNRNTSPSEVAASLTSGEIATIQYQLINDLSLKTPKYRIKYFHRLFGYLLQDYNNW